MSSASLVTGLTCAWSTTHAGMMTGAFGRLATRGIGTASAPGSSACRHRLGGGGSGLQRMVLQSLPSRGGHKRSADGGVQGAGTTAIMGDMQSTDSKG
eukprot:437144-Alexandrium_andersonii.AAC.2